jgi:hypothetical protein
MIKHMNIQAYLQSEHVDLVKEDIFVNIALCRFPDDLLREFAHKVVLNYPDGTSEAIQDLRRRALKE